MEAPVTGDNPAYAGQAVYSPVFLRFHDLFVLGFNGNVAWRCSPRRLVRMYDAHVSARHLDKGNALEPFGTGRRHVRLDRLELAAALHAG